MTAPSDSRNDNVRSAGSVSPGSLCPVTTVERAAKPLRSIGTGLTLFALLANLAGCGQTGELTRPESELTQTQVATQR